ncbi:MAG: sulfite exporter TauE/SafE family protein [Clostridiales bacterium]|nr:sulfite exporter TauE/SafE family protein [Clostridia bacterium]MCR4563901.1 sulfite exporter TauE/SafE family protein [Clostridiales bacterium]
MSGFIRYALIGIIVLLANILESITGFGATVAELPFVSALVGIKTAVVALCMVSLTLAVFVVIRFHKDIDKKAYLNIVGFALLGMPVGMLAFSYLPERALKIALGIFIILAAARGFFVLFSKKENRKPVNGIVLRILLFIGGVVHGAFASGGPFLVIYAGEKIREKGSFRATMCSVWATLNSVLLIKYIITGDFTVKTVMPVYLLAIPFLAVGVAIGMFLHKKVSQKVFSIIVYCILLAAGCTMLGLAIAG